MTLTSKDIVKLGIFPTLVFLINLALISWWPEWSDYWQLDTPLHFFGGLSIAYSVSFALSLLEKAGAIRINRRWLRALLIISSVISVAVLWEIYELISDRLVGTNFQLSSFDTVKDLIMGAEGGIFFCFSLFRDKNNLTLRS